MSLRRRALFVAATLPLLPFPGAPRAQVAHRLTILHFNDFHSRHAEVNRFDSACTAQQREQVACEGGAARLAAAVAADRAAAQGAGRAVIVLDAGDQFMGSLFYTVHRGAAEAAVLNAIGVDAMAVGNHEFDNGPPVLAAFIGLLRAPLLSANTDASAEPLLAGKIRPFVVIERAGLKIGVVGLTTETTPVVSSPGPNVRFTPARAALEQAAGAARAEGAQLVIALSHLGVGADRALGGQVAGVGVVVGGHSHTLLSNGARGAEGPFPVIAEGPAGRALVVQAGAHGRWLGRLDLDLDGQGNILAWGGDARVLSQDLPGDPGVAQIVAGFAAPLQEALRRVVARAPQPIDQSTCRTGECAMGNLVAEAIRAHANAEVALYNGGGLRASFAGGDITWGDVLTVLPFQNTLATLGLRGADLRAALEHGFAQPGGGRFPQIAGARVVWNPAAPPGSRIIELTVGGQPLDDARVYRVATNNFLRRGGDAYAVLRDAAIDPYDNGPNIEVVVEEAITRMGEVTVALDGRIGTR